MDTKTHNLYCISLKNINENCCCFPGKGSENSKKKCPCVQNHWSRIGLKVSYLNACDTLKLNVSNWGMAANPRDSGHCSCFPTARKWLSQKSFGGWLKVWPRTSVILVTFRASQLHGNRLPQKFFGGWLKVWPRTSVILVTFRASQLTRSVGVRPTSECIATGFVRPQRLWQPTAFFKPPGRPLRVCSRP